MGARDRPKWYVRGLRADAKFPVFSFGPFGYGVALLLVFRLAMRDDISNLFMETEEDRLLRKQARDQGLDMGEP